MLLVNALVNRWVVAVDLLVLVVVGLVCGGDGRGCT